MPMPKSFRWPWQRFGILKRLKRGGRVHVMLTYACTLDCSYCMNRVYSGTRPTSDTIPAERWRGLIRGHHEKLREVVLSGGEPMLHPGFVELTRSLLADGLFVTVYTNLTLLDGLKLPESYRLHFVASFHRSYKIKKFLEHLAMYRNKFRVSVEEVGTKMVPGSNCKAQMPCADHSRYFAETPCGWQESCVRCFMNYYSPDGSLHGSIIDSHRYAVLKYGPQDTEEK